MNFELSDEQVNMFIVAGVMPWVALWGTWLYAARFRHYHRARKHGFWWPLSLLWRRKGASDADVAAGLALEREFYEIFCDPPIEHNNGVPASVPPEPQTPYKPSGTVPRGRPVTVEELEHLRDHVADVVTAICDRLDDLELEADDLDGAAIQRVFLRPPISVTVSHEPDERIVNFGEDGDRAVPIFAPYPPTLTLIARERTASGHNRVAFARCYSTVTFEWEGDGADSPTLHELRRAAANYIGE